MLDLGLYGQHFLKFGAKNLSVLNAIYLGTLKLLGFQNVTIVVNHRQIL